MDQIQPPPTDNTIVVNGITYFRRLPEPDNYKEKFEYLVGYLKDQIENAEALYTDFKDQGLTFNTIEAEGYLRFAKVVEDIIKRAENYNSDT